jgi:hypothetical protein
MATVSPNSPTQMQAATIEAIQQANNNLRTARPPTAPASDIQMSRKAIIESSAPSILLLQLLLGLLVLCLIGYALLPLAIAHGLAIILLAVGIALGIFLKK